MTLVAGRTYRWKTTGFKIGQGAFEGAELVARQFRGLLLVRPFERPATCGQALSDL
mgnify:CR=1 FL=1